jgi:photosystem II stability/assembly factor-like uncharacterized protein
MRLEKKFGRPFPCLWLGLVLPAVTLATMASWGASADQGSSPARTNRFLAVSHEGSQFVSETGAAWNHVPHLARDEWTNWRSLTRGRDRLVAVGTDGLLYSSKDDGHSWSRVPLVIPSALHRVVWGQERFVAVGNEGTIVVSRDGEHWEQASAGTDERLRGIAAGKGCLVAVGHGGVIVRSCDGRRWRTQKSPTAQRLTDVAFGDGRFVAVGWNGIILVSVDGRQWEQQSVGPEHRLVRIRFTNE